MLITLDYFYSGFLFGMALIVFIIAVKLTIDTVKELKGK